MNEHFNEQQREFLQFLQLMDENKILEHIIIAGSWAEYIYAQSGVLPGFSLALRTIDIDFLIKNIRRPATPVSLAVLAKEKGYSVCQDVLLSTTKIFTPGGLEIEFLVSQKGSGEEPVLKTNLGVNAQALRHLDMLNKNAVAVEFLGMTVQVPAPEAYVLHKIVINKERKPEKQSKDVKSVMDLFPYLDIAAVGAMYGELTKKEKGEVREFMEKNANEISSGLSVEQRIAFTKFRKNMNWNTNNPRAKQIQSER